MNDRGQHTLDGARVLVAEDRSAVAMELCDLLEDAGCEIIGPASRVERAQELVSESVDLALLDIDLKGETTYPVARRLRRRGVPVLLLTGFDQSTVPEDLHDLTTFEKPIAPAELLGRMARELQR